MMTTSLTTTLLQADPGGFALGDFWSLTQQAGPLRWPIFAVLGFGLIQVFIKLWELVRDQRVSAQLYAMDVTSMSLKELTTMVGRQQESMLSTLQSTMLNVFQTRPAEGMLHDEITNFVAFQQSQFVVFRGRMEFLSDTAGALGLMGTVWGMFTVFFQGSAEQDVILRGMGIALITTLLGLVVSIILNFSSTELSTFFGKRLEQVSRKSDELRFRLMELAPPAAAPLAAEAIGAAPPRPAPESAPGGTKTPPVSAARSHSSSARAPSWRYLEHANGARSGRAGETLKDVTVLVKNQDGAPAAGVPVMVSVVGADGALEGGGRTLRKVSDASGQVGFECVLPSAVGTLALDVSLPEQPGPSTRVEVAVVPGPPELVRAEGNHQAAVAGMKLPIPLGVRICDRFGNAITNVPVRFRVTEGGGKLGAGKSEVQVETDQLGRASTPFVVSSEVGQNGVTALVVGSKHSVDFVAFGTEV
jgi:biopolymer transport protein ExbB/TolQ